MITINGILSNRIPDLKIGDKVIYFNRYYGIIIGEDFSHVVRSYFIGNTDSKFKRTGKDHWYSIRDFERYGIEKYYKDKIEKRYDKLHKLLEIL